MGCNPLATHRNASPIVAHLLLVMCAGLVGAVISAYDSSGGVSAEHPSPPADSFSIDRKTLDRWSAPYRNWHHYPRPVVTAALEPELEFTMVDGPNVFWHEGQWQMFYFGYDGRGYQACRAVSDDLVSWEPLGLLMSYGDLGTFDHGGVVFTGALYDTVDVREPPRLARWNDRYWVLYGCYPEQGGYELGSGGQGLAWSDDGFHWNRFSRSEPILSIDGGAKWEERVMCSPCLVWHEGLFWNFYNARGAENTEPIGFARSRNLVSWERYAGDPVIANRTGGYDAMYSLSTILAMRPTTCSTALLAAKGGGSRCSQANPLRMTLTNKAIVVVLPPQGA